MLIAEWLAWIIVLLISLTGIGLLVLLYGFLRLKIGGKWYYGFPLKFPFAPLLGLAAVGFPLYFFIFSPSACAVVTEAGSHLSYRSYVIMGTPVYTLRNGRTVTVDRYAIINDTSRSLRYGTLIYGYGGESSWATIEPSSVLWTNPAIYHFGPDDHPPQSVQTSPGGTTRYWLTWDL